VHIGPEERNSLGRGGGSSSNRREGEQKVLFKRKKFNGFDERLCMKKEREGSRRGRTTRLMKKGELCRKGRRGSVASAIFLNQLKRVG